MTLRVVHIQDIAWYKSRKFDNYPTLAPHNDKKGDRKLAILELSFNGLSIKANIELIFGEFGFMAQEDPNQMKSFLKVLKSSASVVLAETDMAHFASDSDLLLIKCLEILESEDPYKTFQDAIALAQSLEALILSIEPILESQEMSIFLLGIKLGHWRTNLAPRLKNPNAKVLSEIEKYLEIAIKDSESRLAAKKIIHDRINDSESVFGSDIPLDLYFAAKNGLRDQITAIKSV